MPARARREIVNFNVEVPPEVTVAGEKLAVTPEGRPEADSFTVWVDPLVAAVTMEVLIEELSFAEPDDGLATIEKVPVVTAVVTLNE